MTDLPPEADRVRPLGWVWLVLAGVWLVVGGGVAEASELTVSDAVRVGVLADGRAPVDVVVGVAEVSGWEPATVRHVVIARDDDPADALASGVLQRGGPLLLVPTDGPVPEAVWEVIGRLEVGRAVVVGGEAAVSAAVVDELAAGGVAVERLAGGSRSATAVAVAERALAGGRIEGVLLASTRSGSSHEAISDVVTAGGVSARLRAPVLLTEQDHLPEPTRAFLEANLSVTRSVMIVGGEAAVSRRVEEEVATVMGSRPVQRVAGETRSGTAVALAGLGGHGSAAEAAGVVVVDGVSTGGWVGGLASAGLAYVADVPIVVAVGSGIGPSVTVAPETASFLAGGVGGSAWGTGLVCVTSTSVCERVREALGRPGVVSAVLDPPGGRLVAGQLVGVEVDDGGEAQVSGSCVDGSRLVAGRGQVPVVDPLPDGPCVVAVAVGRGGVTATTSVEFNDPVRLLAGARVRLDADRPIAELPLPFQAGDRLAMGWSIADFLGGCFTATIIDPSGAEVFRDGPSPDHESTCAVSPEPPVIEAAEDGVWLLRLEWSHEPVHPQPPVPSLRVFATLVESESAQVHGAPVRLTTLPGQAVAVRFDGRAGELISISSDAELIDPSWTTRGRVTATLQRDGAPDAYQDVTHLGTFARRLPADGTYTLTVRNDTLVASTRRVWINRIDPAPLTLDGPPATLTWRPTRPGEVPFAAIQVQPGDYFSLGTVGLTDRSLWPFAIRTLGEADLAPATVDFPGDPSRRADVEQRGRPSDPQLSTYALDEPGTLYVALSEGDHLRPGDQVSVWATRVVPMTVQLGQTLQLAHTRPGQVTDLRTGPVTPDQLLTVDLITDQVPGCWDLEVHDQLDTHPTYNAAMAEPQLIRGDRGVPYEYCTNEVERYEAEFPFFPRLGSEYTRQPEGDVRIAFGTRSQTGPFTITVDNPSRH